MENEKRFSRDKWLEKARKQMNDGYLSQREVDDALSSWVNKIDGMTKTEIQERFGFFVDLNEDWLI